MAHSLPDAAGIGYKPAFHDALMGDEHGVHFVEVHAENYLGDGGPPHRRLRELSERFRLSVHGVGLSLGGAERPNRAHLLRIRQLLDRYPVASFSEHLAWSTHDGRWVPDLLPVAYDRPTLERVVAHVDETQSVLGRRILMENPSSYLRFPGSYSESQFLAELAQRSGCGLLLDINNLFVSASNHGEQAEAWIDAINPHQVGELHVAGHARIELDDGRSLRVDDHGSAPNAAVWALLRRFLRRAGPKPVLLEWDTAVPAWSVLHEHVARITRESGRAMAERLIALRVAA